MKFKNYIETESGIKDTSTSPGAAGQVLSSTVTGTSWIDPDTLVSAASKLVVIACKNVSGTPILKGTPVYQSGTVGATDVIEVEPANATISTGYLPAIGILQTTLNNNGFGNVVITGEFLNYSTADIPTDRPGGDPFTGDTVYLAAGGGLTCIKPTGAGNAIQNLGLVGKVSGGNAGSITVASIMRANDVPNLPEGRIWIGDGNTIVSDTVYVDEPNNRVGVGTTSPNAKLEVVGTTGVIVDSGSNSAALLTLKGDASSYGGGGQINIIGGSYDYMYYATNIMRSGSPNINEARESYDMLGNTWVWDGNMGNTAFQPYTSYDFKSQGSSQMVIYNNNVGIGTTSPSQKLHVVGSGYFQNGNVFVGSTSNTMFNYISTFVILAGSGQTIALGGGPGNVNNNVLIGNGNLSVSGNVGVGTTNPGAKLDVFGNANIGNDHTNFAGASFNVNLGFQNYNNGFAAIATGQGTLADASHSFSMGYQSKATGIASLAGGNVSTVTTLPSEAAGDASLAFGNGVKTNATANFSQAFGRQTTTGGGSTSANQAMAIGYDSTAWADNSFSGGNNSDAFGEESFAFGAGATASKGDSNIALGIGVTTPTDATAAYGAGQVAVGKYNVYNTAGVSHVFAVGAGTSNASRYNAFNVTSTGRIGINGVTNPFTILHAKLNDYSTGFYMEGPASTSFNYMAFYSGTSYRGAISPTSTGVNYNSASDYRLKENVTKLNNSTERIKKLKPSNFNFLENPNETVDGFIAHEVQGIVPEAVTGKKDAVEPDGKPIYQSIDQSKIVPLLTAALQEAISKIEQLETRIQKLENK